MPTLNEQLYVFPYPSRAVQVTRVEPIVKLVPEGGLQITVGLSPELSVADGSCHSIKAVGCPGSVFLVWLAGQDSSTGFSLSIDMHKRNVQNLNDNVNIK